MFILFTFFFQVRKVLKGVKVEATHQGRHYRITGLTPKSSSQMMYVTSLEL